MRQLFDHVLVKAVHQKVTSLAFISFFVKWSLILLKQMENSPWDTKISGIEVKPSGKRGSLLVQANEVKEKNTNSHGTPAKVRHKTRKSNYIVLLLTFLGVIGRVGGGG